MMRQFGINIDDPANLARMMDDAHRVLHTNNYYAYVTERVRHAKNGDEMRAVLRDMKNLLEGLKNREDARRHFPPASRP